MVLWTSWIIISVVCIITIWKTSFIASRIISTSLSLAIPEFDSNFLVSSKYCLYFSFSFTIYLHLKQLIPDYDRQPNEELEDQLFHKDVNITSRLLNDLIISFRWRPEINQHLIKDLLNWISQSTQTAPDFILIGYFIKFKIRLLKC